MCCTVFSCRCFAFKQDAVPGMGIPVHFTATKMGEYEVACAELCGMQHYKMRARFLVMTRRRFRRMAEGEERAIMAQQAAVHAASAKFHPQLCFQYRSQGHRHPVHFPGPVLGGSGDGAFHAHAAASGVAGGRSFRCWNTYCRRAFLAARCRPSFTSRCLPSTGPSWCFSCSRRFRCRASATSFCRFRSARAIWLFRC